RALPRSAMPNHDAAGAPPSCPPPCRPRAGSVKTGKIETRFATGFEVMAAGLRPEHRTHPLTRTRREQRYSGRMQVNHVLLGRPGAGNGTQASRLTRMWRIPHISTGAILRDAIRDGTPLGKQVESIISSGGLVDDGLVTQIVQARL